MLLFLITVTELNGLVYDISDMTQATGTVEVYLTEVPSDGVDISKESMTSSTKHNLRFNGKSLAWVPLLQAKYNWMIDVSEIYANLFENVVLSVDGSSASTAADLVEKGTFGKMGLTYRRLDVAHADPDPEQYTRLNTSLDVSGITGKGVTIDKLSFGNPSHITAFGKTAKELVYDLIVSQNPGLRTFSYHKRDSTPQR
ncbi:hypothetical protein SPFM12_00041 [Salmonella phage SPFM12]|nr:hypothetical protein SPFM12_00041 [Salmonella phage SPFM12]